MEKIEENQRVVAAANPTFAGRVTRVSYEGAGGFVLFDGAEEDQYFSAQELEPEPAPESV